MSIEEVVLAIRQAMRANKIIEIWPMGELGPRLVTDVRRSMDNTFVVLYYRGIEGNFKSMGIWPGSRQWENVAKQIAS